MPRKYTDIKQYENQIMEMRAAGKTRREIAQALGLEKEQIKGWISRFNREQRKLEAGIKPRPKGRPRKDAEARDIVAEQAYEIERLKMENKLLRDFMRLAGRR
jgi:transposase